MLSDAELSVTRMMIDANPNPSDYMKQLRESDDFLKSEMKAFKAKRLGELNEDVKIYQGKLSKAQDDLETFNAVTFPDDESESADST